MGREEYGGEMVNGGGKCQRERGTEMRLSFGLGFKIPLPGFRKQNTAITDGLDIKGVIDYFSLLLFKY